MKKVYLIAVAATLFTAGVLQRCGSEKSSEHEGKDSLADTGSVQARIAKLTDLIRKSPTNYEYYFERSLLYYESGNTYAAIEDIDKCIENDLKWPEGYHMRAFYFMKSNQYDSALIFFQKAVELGSSNPRTFHSIGQIHFEQGNYNEAEKWFETAMKLDSLDPQFIMDKALVFEARKQYDKAIEYHQKALKVEPGFTKSLARLYLIYKDVKKDMVKALNYNDLILAVDSLHPVGTYNQAEFYMDRALAITDTTRSEDFRIMLGQAISNFSKCIDRAGRFLDAEYKRAYCYWLL